MFVVRKIRLVKNDTTILTRIDYKFNVSPITKNFTESYRTMMFKWLLYIVLFLTSTSVYCYDVKHKKDKYGINVWTISQTYIDDTKISMEYLCHYHTPGLVPDKWKVDLGYPINLDYETDVKGFYRLNTDKLNLCTRPYYDEDSPSGMCHKLEGSLDSTEEKFLMKYAEIKLNRSYYKSTDRFRTNEITETVSKWSLDWYPKALEQANKECLEKQDEVGSHTKRLLNKLFD
jgi:hypothetical protein